MTNTRKITIAVSVTLPPGTSLLAAGNLLAHRCPEPRPARTYSSQFSRWFLS